MHAYTHTHTHTEHPSKHTHCKEAHDSHTCSWQRTGTNRTWPSTHRWWVCGPEVATDPGHLTATRLLRIHLFNTLQILLSPFTHFTRWLTPMPSPLSPIPFTRFLLITIFLKGGKKNIRCQNLSTRTRACSSTYTTLLVEFGPASVQLHTFARKHLPCINVIKCDSTAALTRLAMKRTW